ncbi:hypothetical protein MBLNU459_g4918t1 [Dothideomycetes sp. NU459]
MSEFIGSRISLISKSDIKSVLTSCPALHTATLTAELTVVYHTDGVLSRYVGTLHEINSENSTVALENVKSFGTEGRRGNPDEEIPPNDQIYDYIVFRGSDVKDLTIVEAPKENKPPQPPQVPNDPAILGAARPGGAPGAPPQQPPFQQSANQQWRGPQPPGPPFSPYGYPHPPPQQNTRFAPPGGPHGFPTPGAPPGYGMQYGPPPGWFPPGQGPQAFPQGPPGPFSPQPIGPPGQQTNQQRTPGAGAQLTPSGAPHDQSTPAQESARPAPPPAKEAERPTSASANIAPPAPLVESKPDVAAATAPAQPAQSKPSLGGPRDSRIAVPLQAKPGNAPKSATATAAHQNQNATQAAAAAVAAAMAKLGPIQAGKPAGHTGVDNLTQKVSEMRTDDRTRQTGRGGFAPGHRGGRGNRRPSTRENGPKPVDVPTTDFDFEGSNAKFNKQDLVKQAIASGSPAGTPAAESELKLPVNGGSNGAAGGAENDVAQQDGDVVIPKQTYNKSTSFFDNISSELKDRQAAQEGGGRVGGMEFRSEERKKNFETFGQANVDNGYRGGVRGRGRGRGGLGGRGRGFAGGRGGFVPRGGAPRGRGESMTAET